MNRDAYLKKLKARLDEWGAELERLEAKARGAGQDVRIQYDKEIETVRRQMDQAREKYNDIQSAGEDMWESLKDDAEDFWNRIGNAMEDARAAMK